MSKIKTNESSNKLFFLDCTCKTMLTLCCICSVQELRVGVKKTEVGIDFSPVLVLLDENTEDYFTSS